MKNLIAWLLLCASAWAQTSTGGLSGVVLDATGAVVESAVVEATDGSTGAKSRTLTTEAGVFRVSGMRPGSYTLTIEKSGFKPWRSGQIEILPGSDLARTVHLELDDLSSTVTVTDTAFASAMETIPNNGSRGGAFTPFEVSGAPLLGTSTGRNYRALAFQLPGVAPTRTAHAPFSVNGNRPISSMNTMVDSAEYNDVVSGNLLGRGATEQPVSMETVEAFEMVTGNFKAEYGRASGAVINLITRRGSNAWHGAAYNYFQNSATNARNPMLTEKPPLRSNQPGVTLGGPVLRDRLFFFGGYEITARNVYGASSTVQTLTDEQRPRAVPAVRAIAALFPAPNVAGTALHSASIADPQTVRTGILRGDARIGSMHDLGYRANWVQSVSRMRERLPAGNADGGNRSLSHVINFDSAFTPSIFNQARATYTRFQSRVVPDYPSLGDPALNGYVGVIRVTGLPVLGQFRTPGRTTFHNYTVGDDVTWSFGRHIVKAGGIFRQLQPNTVSDRDFNGTLIFPTVDAFLAGRPVSYTRSVGDSRLDLRGQEYGVYVQDDWRVRTDLTLNLGVRWEYYSIPEDKYGRIQQLYNPDRNNFAPRFGFAWNIGGTSTTIVRGGYGIFYTPLQMDFVGQARFAPPLVYSYSRTSPVFPNLLDGAALRTNLSVLDREVVQPWAQNWNFAVERQLLSPAHVVTVAWVGNRGLHLPRTTRPNGGENLAQNLRPDPSVGIVNYLETSASSIYHSLQVSTRSMLGRSLSVRTAYTWGAGIDDVSDAAAFPVDDQNLRRDRARSDFDQPHIVSATGVWSLPFLKANRWLGGWQLGSLFVYRMGSPFSILSNTNNPTGTLNNRINHVPGAILRQHSGTQWLAVAPAVRVADLVPQAGAIGTLGRNTERSPAFADVSLSLQKEMPITEHVRFEIRGEAFNALNRTNLDAPTNNIGNALFGQILSAGAARQFQFAARLLF